MIPGTDWARPEPDFSVSGDIPLLRNPFEASENCRPGRTLPAVPRRADMSAQDKGLSSRPAVQTYIGRGSFLMLTIRLRDRLDAFGVGYASADRLKRDSQGSRVRIHTHRSYLHSQRSCLSASPPRSIASRSDARALDLHLNRMATYCAFATTAPYSPPRTAPRHQVSSHGLKRALRRSLRRLLRRLTKLVCGATRRDSVDLVPGVELRASVDRLSTRLGRQVGTTEIYRQPCVSTVRGALTALPDRILQGRIARDHVARALGVELRDRRLHSARLDSGKTMRERSRGDSRRDP